MMRFDDDEANLRIEQPKRRGDDHQRLDRDDVCHVAPAKVAPSREGALERGGRYLPTQVAHADTKLERFAMNSRRAPEQVGETRLMDHVTDFVAHLGSFIAWSPPPTDPKVVAMSFATVAALTSI